MTFQLIDTLKVHQRKRKKSIEDDEDEDTNLLFSRMKKRGKRLLHSDKRKAVHVSRNCGKMYVRDELGGMRIKFFGI